MNDFKSVSLADQVFEKLENDIIMGIYPRGEILTELKLVEQLGVSRTPIREALRRLEQERLIWDTGKGSQVRGITEDDLVDIMNIREHIEGLAAFHAAQNMTEEGLKEFAHILDLQDFYFEKWDSERLHQVDDEFHAVIAKLCDRTMIYDTLVPLHKKTRRFRRIAMDNKERAACTLKEHRAIYEAFAAGDAELARKLTMQHIVNARNHMLGSMKNDG